MPKGQVNIKMARDESRRLRKVPAAALAQVGAKNSPTPAGKKAKLEPQQQHGPSSSPNRKNSKAAGAKSALNDSVISGKEDRRSKLKRAQ